MSNFSRITTEVLALTASGSSAALDILNAEGFALHVEYGAIAALAGTFQLQGRNSSTGAWVNMAVAAVAAIAAGDAFVIDAIGTSIAQVRLNWARTAGNPGNATLTYCLKGV